ncbi:LysE family translocator [Mangrovitalea sediminis]|uniref:LysE family translocator n=1 Tax=Mangrovitalea sediminis TaxID=1982043 RepID=UPI000BE4FB6F|nr:LysE family translocator [Mangrovitalea sediminis]
MENLWMFIAALVVVYLVPGPDMLLVLETGVVLGRGKALAVAFGLGIARMTHVILAALGLAALFKSTPWTFDAVRILGGAYLILLGGRMFFSGGLGASAQERSQTSSPALKAVGYKTAVRRGLLTNLLNPKALVFCSVLLPQFVQPGGGSMGTQFALLGVVLVALGLGFDAAYAMAGHNIGKWLTRSPVVQRLQSFVFASLMIGLGIRLAVWRTGF